MKSFTTDSSPTSSCHNNIAFRLGFRTLYLAGCDMHVAPCSDWREQAEQLEVQYTDRELLRDFLQRCRQRGLSHSDQQLAGQSRQYHFDEVKSLAAAVQTDLHYFRVAQYLRLSRRAVSSAGLEIISVTPGSRLNDYFRYQPIQTVLQQIRAEIGDPLQEGTRGLYSEQVARSPAGLGPMRDFRPHNWSKETSPSPVARSPSRGVKSLGQLANALREIPVPIRETH